MMRRLQPVGGHRQRRVEQRPFSVAIDIAGQQQTLTVGLHLQDAGFRVAANSIRPLPHFKHDPVPLPLLATDTRLGAQKRRQALGFAAYHAPDRHASGHCGRAPRVIGIGMAEQ